MDASAASASRQSSTNSPTLPQLALFRSPRVVPAEILTTFIPYLSALAMSHETALAAEFAAAGCRRLTFRCHQLAQRGSTRADPASHSQERSEKMRRMTEASASVTAASGAASTSDTRRRELTDNFLQRALSPGKFSHGPKLKLLCLCDEDRATYSTRCG